MPRHVFTPLMAIKGRKSIRADTPGMHAQGTKRQTMGAPRTMTPTEWLVECDFEVREGRNRRLLLSFRKWRGLNAQSAFPQDSGSVP